MTSRERVFKAINHEIPDFVPIDIGGTANGISLDVMAKLKAHFHIQSEDLVFYPFEEGGRYNDDVLEMLGGDFRHVFLMPPTIFRIESIKIIDNEFFNEWGMKKRLIKGMAQQVGYPLCDDDPEDIEKIEKFPWPDPYDESRITGMRDRAKLLYETTDYSLSARAPCHGIFETAWEMRSMENMLVDMLINKDYAGKLLDKITDIQIGMYDMILSEAGKYLQIIQTADDYGMQSGPMMSTELFREMILPRRKRLNDFIKSKAPHIKISHHTCGSVYKLIEELIDSGIDILNPVQPLAKEMDTARIKLKFGERLGFHGSIDEQRALPGTLMELEEEIKTRILDLAPGGGFIIAPTSNFQDDMPLENILSFVPFARKYGVPEFYEKNT